MGRSGAVGPDVNLIYETMQNPSKFGAFIGKGASALLETYGGSLGRHFGWALALIVRSMIAGKLERARPEKALSDDGVGLRRYLEVPVMGQLREELEGGPLPEDVTVVFGHTHKPFQQVMKMANFVTPYVRVYNSGGWVVDRPKPQSLYGGAVILFDEALEAVSLRMYNECEQSSGYRVVLSTAGPMSNSSSSFHKHISDLIKPQSPPWSDFSKAIASAVERRTRELAASLA
jgi:hypothetical protein